MILYYHPLSSYCWKVLIAFHENGTPFTPRILEDEAALRFHLVHYLESPCEPPIVPVPFDSVQRCRGAPRHHSMNPIGPGQKWGQPIRSQGQKPRIAGSRSDNAITIYWVTPLVPIPQIVPQPRRHARG